MAKSWCGRLLSVAVLAVLLRPAIAEQADADAASAYVILDAVRIPGTAPQPTWIGLSMAGFGVNRMVHVPVGDTVVRLPPGRYTVRHIDFEDDPKSGVGTMEYHPQAQPITFEASAEWVSFVGLIQLQRVVRNFSDGLGIGLATPDEMLSWACAVDPKLLAERPVRVRLERTTYQLKQIRCAG